MSNKRYSLIIVSLDKSNRNRRTSRRLKKVADIGTSHSLQMNDTSGMISPFHSTSCSNFLIITLLIGTYAVSLCPSYMYKQD